MIKAFWCWLFHGHYTHETWAGGDWRHLRCDKCQITWPEPRR
jgi:hypothetical protein